MCSLGIFLNDQNVSSAFFENLLNAKNLLAEKDQRGIRHQGAVPFTVEVYARCLYPTLAASYFKYLDDIRDRNPYSDRHPSWRKENLAGRLVQSTLSPAVFASRNMLATFASRSFGPSK
jgi:hypothetical protein